MNNRPALHASRIFSWPAEPSHHKQDTRQVPGPNVRVSPLATPAGASGEVELRDCRTCANRPDCAAILEAIRARKTFCSHDIHKDTDLHSSTIAGHLSHLLTAGTIRRIGRANSIGTPIMYELVEEA